MSNTRRLFSLLLILIIVAGLYPPAEPAYAVTGALSFTSGSITFGSYTSFGNTSDHSFEIWEKGTSGASQALINDGDAGGEGSSIHLYGGNQYEYVYKDTGILSNASNAADGTAHHFVASYDSGTNKVTLYVDGSLDKTSAALGTWSADAQNNFIFGKDQSGGRQFAGTMDEAAIYTKALSSSEVSTHYNSGNGRCGLSTDSGILYGYHLDEAGSPIKSYATANDGTYSGGITTTSLKTDCPAEGGGGGRKTLMQGVGFNKRSWEKSTAGLIIQPAGAHPLCNCGCGSHLNPDRHR